MFAQFKLRTLMSHFLLQKKKKEKKIWKDSNELNLWSLTGLKKKKQKTTQLCADMISCSIQLVWGIWGVLHLTLIMLLGVLACGAVQMKRLKAPKMTDNILYMSGLKKMRKTGLQRHHSYLFWNQRSSQTLYQPSRSNPAFYQPSSYLL